MSKGRDLRCPYCEDKELVFSVTQKGYGYVPDMELWTCKLCLGTFSVKSSGKRGNGNPDNGAMNIGK